MNLSTPAGGPAIRLLASAVLAGAAAGGAWVLPLAAAQAREAAPVDARQPDVLDDRALQSAVEWARQEFLATQPFNRFSVTVLLEQDGRWIRGSVDGDVLAYPASCVKLPFLLAAVHWCAERGRSPDCLDASVRPMVVDSDNVATGVLVAVVTGRAEPQAASYTRSLPERPSFSPQSSLGSGLPPGSRHESKLGTAFDTLEDVMHAVLPNGRRLIIAAFTNGWDQGEPEPWDAARLGRFTELLIDRFRSAKGVPPPRYLPARSAGAAAGPPDSAAALGTWVPRQERAALSAAGYLQSAGAPGRVAHLVARCAERRALRDRDVVSGRIRPGRHRGIPGRARDRN